MQARLACAYSEGASDPAATVRAILSAPNAGQDYARAKLALDRLIDPSIDTHAITRELDDLAGTAALLAGPGADVGAKLAAVRRSIYEAGPWNSHRPFAYDHADPAGTHLPNKLLHNYLARRLGNCVSMPILLLILGDRLGLDLALASAPHHMLVRLRLADGRSINIEATSGGHPARTEWYRHNFPMSDRALASGLYMRSLSRREGVALMATTVLEKLELERRHEEAIAVAQAILDHDARAGQVMVAQASAYGGLLARLRAEHPVPFLIPAHLRPRHLMLIERNNSLFAAAEALGWEPAPDFENGVPDIPLEGAVSSCS